jgi:hypothetical protein
VASLIRNSVSGKVWNSLPHRYSHLHSLFVSRGSRSSTFHHIQYANDFPNTTLSKQFFLTGFYSPYRTLAFLNGLLDPQTFVRTPWLGDQSNARPLPKHRTTQHRNTQTHIHAPSRIRTWDLNVQAVLDSTCLRPLGYWDPQVSNYFYE